MPLKSKKIFKNFLHPEFVELVNSLDRQGVKVGIVGGTVRDFFLGQGNKHDYDVEIRFKKLIPLDQLVEQFLNLSFPSEMKKEILPYNIIKLVHLDFSCELSLPRKETFFQDEFGHKNFSADFIHDENYQIGFGRRDFTLNAIMYEYTSESDWRFIDPLNGLVDLKNSLLKSCSNDFNKDPVRFLRAIRFSILLDLKIDSKLLNDFKGLDFSSLPSHYIHREAKKSKKPMAFALAFLKHTTFMERNDTAAYVYDEMFLLKYELMVESKISNHVKRYFFIKEEVLKYLYRFYDLKMMKNQIYLKDYKHFNLEAFLKNSFVDVKKSIIKLQKLKEIESLLQMEEFYFEQAKKYLHLPFYYKSLMDIKTSNIDFKDILKEDRGTFQIYERLKLVYLK